MKASLQAIVDTFTAPTQAFARVREREVSAWPPFLLVLLSVVVVTTWYFTTIDPRQFMAEQMALSGQDISPQELAMASEQMAKFLPFSGIIPTAFLVLYYAITALYLHLVATVATEAELKYSRWFSTVSYAFLPGLIAMITAGVNYALAGDNYISFDKLDLTSLNNLFLNLPMQNPWAGFINALSLANLWTLALLVVGYKTLTQGSWGGAIAVVLIPALLIFGGWAAYIVLGA